MTGLTITKSGILSTVQDSGRRGAARFGINPGGPMDTAAARIANIICGNDESAAFIELHFPAPEIRFESPALFSITGGDFSPALNDIPIRPWSLQRAAAGDTLSFKFRLFGARAYLAVRGGFEADSWLGSRSTNLGAGIGGHHGRSLMKGDFLRFPKPDTDHLPQILVSKRMLPYYTAFPTVRFIPGPEFGLLDPKSSDAFVGSNFELSPRSNRMGFRLIGPPLRLREPKEMLSTAAGFGTIQLLPDGQLIVLMADHQTTGGYPRIASIIPTDLPLAAQIQTGGKIAFHEVAPIAAESLFFNFENDLQWLRTACRLRFDAIDRS